MKYSELPKEYKKLADKYELPDDFDRSHDLECIEDRFVWGHTDEGADFWDDVYIANSVDDLPHIPFESAINVDSTEYYESGTQVGKDLSTEQYLDSKSSPLNAQIGGDHYINMKITPREYINANELGWDEGNVVKYISRWRKKNGIEDLKKCRHYIDLLIEQEEEREEALTELTRIGQEHDL